MDKNKILVDAFKWLFIGLMMCFISSYATTNIKAIWDIVMSSPIIVFGVLILEIVIVIVLSALIKKMSPLVAKIVYIMYTMLTGVSLSWILLAYTGVSIVSVFLATSLVFGAFAIIGQRMNVDLTKFGLYLFLALIGIIIVTIINIFLGNETIMIVTSIFGVLIFAGYVAYDIKFALEKSQHIGENAGIYCAFQLFIDFINLFIDLLRLFGKERD